MNTAVVIGASGAIGRALLRACGLCTSVVAFARSEVHGSLPVTAGEIDVTDERSIASAAAVVARQFGLVLCASGILHGPEML
jgi:NAD(P)-dependent dehydrogenase (short-subunit alcohol dehydrogenase family)